MEIREERKQTQYFKVQTCHWSYIGAEEIMEPGSTAGYLAITNFSLCKKGRMESDGLLVDPSIPFDVYLKQRPNADNIQCFSRWFSDSLEEVLSRMKAECLCRSVIKRLSYLWLKTLNPFSLISPKGLVFLSDCQFMVHFQIPFVVYWQFINLTLLSFGAGWFFVVGAVLCIAGCLVASLTSTC